MREILPHQLWVGHGGDARDYRTLLSAGVEAVVQVAVDEPPLSPPRELVVVRVPLADGPGNDPRLLWLAVTTAAELLRAGLSVLVCCGSGLSRSPAVTAAALALVEGTAPDACLRRVAAAGPADVDPGLWAELKRALIADAARPPR